MPTELFLSPHLIDLPLAEDRLLPGQDQTLAQGVQARPDDYLQVVELMINNDTPYDEGMMISLLRAKVAKATLETAGQGPSEDGFWDNVIRYNEETPQTRLLTHVFNTEDIAGLNTDVASLLTAGKQAFFIINYPTRDSEETPFTFVRVSNNEDGGVAVDVYSTCEEEDAVTTALADISASQVIVNHRRCEVTDRNTSSGPLMTACLTQHLAGQRLPQGFDETLTTFPYWSGESSRRLADAEWLQYILRQEQALVTLKFSVSDGNTTTTLLQTLTDEELATLATHLTPVNSTAEEKVKFTVCCPTQEATSAFMNTLKRSCMAHYTPATICISSDGLEIEVPEPYADTIRRYLYEAYYFEVITSQTRLAKAPSLPATSFQHISKIAERIALGYNSLDRPNMLWSNLSQNVVNSITSEGERPEEVVQTLQNFLEQTEGTTKKYEQGFHLKQLLRARLSTESLQALRTMKIVHVLAKEDKAETSKPTARQLDFRSY